MRPSNLKHTLFAMQRRYRTLPRSGFTLIEVLVVIVIMVILISLSAPSIVSLLRGSRLTTGTDNLVSQLNFARQFAMAKNCQVEVRLYELPDVNTPSVTTPSVYRAFQSYSLSSSGGAATAITKVTMLPDQIYMVNSSTVSSILSVQNPPYFITGTTAGTSLGIYPPSAYSYTSFHFKPDGSTDLNPSSGQTWYLSLANLHDTLQASTGLPPNFITIQVDALTGRVRYFRPN